jgi:hypothetical protein
MSQFERQDFPPLWDPPPRIGYGESRPDLWSIDESLRSDKVDPWVRHFFQSKFAQGMPQLFYDLLPNEQESPMNEVYLNRFLKLFDSIEGSMSREDVRNNYLIEHTLHRALERPEIEEPIKARIRKHLGLKEEAAAVPQENAT